MCRSNEPYRLHRWREFLLDAILTAVLIAAVGVSLAVYAFLFKVLGGL